MHLHDLNLLLLLPLFRDSPQQLLQLLLRDLTPQLPRPSQHNKPVLNVRRAGLFDDADAAQAVGSFGGEDLAEEGGTGFGFALPGRGKKYVKSRGLD